MSASIAIGVRRGDLLLGNNLDQLLARDRTRIEQLLIEYGVPLVADAGGGSGDGPGYRRASHSSNARQGCGLPRSTPESWARGNEGHLMPKKKAPRSRRQSDLSVAVLRSFRVIYGSVREHFREVKQSCGVSGSQVWILHEIRRTEGIGISDLAARLSVHQSTCSLLVNKLVRAKHVVKKKSENRSTPSRTCSHEERPAGAEAGPWATRGCSA